MTTDPTTARSLLDHQRRVHLIGAGGAGMNGIGVVLAEMGHQVTGSDLKESSGVARLRALGAEVVIGHAASNVGEVDLVARSTAVPEDNPEVQAASERGLPVLRRADILAAICARRPTVAVAGTHGKTTTSSMLSLALVEAGRHPSFLVGGDLNEIGSGAVWDAQGDLFVVEADESDGTFLELGAHAVLVTNVEADHLDFYGSLDALERAFERFALAAAGPKVICADDPGAHRLALEIPGVITYGCHPGADYRIVDQVLDGYTASFRLVGPGGDLGPCRLPIPGAHNALNATGAAAMALELGADPVAVMAALGRFAGVARRFEFRGEQGGVVFVDDYAHLPTEVGAAVAAARQGDWGRVVAVFQPHRYSRTADLWMDFGDAFMGADEVVITDIYPAGEQARPGITGELVARAVLDAHPGSPVTYIPSRDELRAHLREQLRSGDLCLTLGAGDLTLLPDELLAAEEPGADGSG